MNNQIPNFANGVDLKPLEDLGIKKEEAIKMVVAMTPFIDLEFKARVRAAFSEEEWRQIGEEGIKRGIKPEEGMFLLEDKYFAKTGRYFMEETRLLFNEYVGHLAEIVKKVRTGVEAVSAAPKSKQEELNVLLEEGKYDEVAKALDLILKKGGRNAGN